MKLLLIGCGNMASAMVKRWLDTNIVSTISTISPSGKTQFINNKQIKSYTDTSQLTDNDFNFIFYMAKPNMVSKILPNYKRLSHIPFVSIAAGIELSTYKRILGESCTIIRIMPNTACSIGAGVTPAFTNDNLINHKKQNLEKLLNSLGSYGWLNNETEMHTVTALSGSGVAYIYYLMDCMAKIATDMGLDDDNSKQWAIQTVLGSALHAKDSCLSLEQLRNNITSPNGTTEQALNVLMDENGLQQLLEKAMNSAYNRSVEMGK